MPWKENNNGDGPWGKPSGEDGKSSKKRQKMDFNSRASTPDQHSRSPFATRHYPHR